ncbi:MAG: DUF1802 family protein [Alkalinema sp. RU_4_3]|nr:DUF1802 family protein [Alkalinema sp. RU_4_3]
MKENIVLDRILSLPASDIKVLQEGKTIAAFPIFQAQKGWNFILHANTAGENKLNEGAPPNNLEYWATCESFRMIHDKDYIPLIAQLTPWEQSNLERMFQDRGHLFLALLRVSQLPEAIYLPPQAEAKIKVGRFIGFLQLDESLKDVPHVTKRIPVLDDNIFANYHRHLERLTPSEHPELEALQAAIVYPNAPFVTHQFNDDIQRFLGWVELKHTVPEVPAWVKEITTSGNSSDGNLFEKRVRQAFIELGFTNTLGNIKASLDPDATGGAGGIDIYCEHPFPIVGECKASQSGRVGNGVCAQLINLGNTNIGRDNFEADVKIIFASGKLNNIHAEPAAKQNKMNVMRPDTLQRLVELKLAYPGSIDLLALEPCLRSEPFGTDADKKVNDFIDQVVQNVSLRSHVIQAVKELKELGDETVTASNVRIHFNATQPEKLDSPEEVQEILVELSSPLAGYLGRIKCQKTWRGDRFYYLRDLPAPKD